MRAKTPLKLKVQPPDVAADRQSAATYYFPSPAGKQKDKTTKKNKQPTSQQCLVGGQARPSDVSGTFLIAYANATAQTAAGSRQPRGRGHWYLRVCVCVTVCSYAAAWNVVKIARSVDDA
ncbi:unnamed protein product [Ceratitis capitata]|uniref:(Mediterranean fruit fly) hypothetical protein n=1 Tax=Ceratitis capitata TaxID=7213 RepID=A0A811U222_CERCA|nr:unnamed protein product [Ceratitis capitata]